MSFADAHHSVITPECRTSRSNEGAWAEAVARAKIEYDAILKGWRESPHQPTLHLILGLERPFVAVGTDIEVRACHHGVPALGEHLGCLKSDGGDYS